MLLSLVGEERSDLRRPATPACREQNECRVRLWACGIVMRRLRSEHRTLGSRTLRSDVGRSPYTRPHIFLRPRACVRGVGDPYDRTFEPEFCERASTSLSCNPRIHQLQCLVSVPSDVCPTHVDSVHTVNCSAKPRCQVSCPGAALLCKLQNSEPHRGKYESFHPRLLLGTRKIECRLPGLGRSHAE